MKTTSTIAAATLATVANGCVTSHNYLSNEGAAGDNMSIDVWVNGRLVCRGGQSELLADVGTKYCLRNHDGKGKGCAKGYAYCTSNNGGDARLEYHQDGRMVWKTEINKVTGSDGETYECGFHNCSWVEYGLRSNDTECSESQYSELCGMAHCTDDAELDPPNPFPWLPVSFKAMFVGDSITQGAEGDFTWRYRLWEWLKSEEVDVEFVGPWTGTHGRVQPEDTLPKVPPLDDYGSDDSESGKPDDSGEYSLDIDGDFPQEHAAMWGRQAAQSKDTIRDWVNEYQPDYVLLMLGFNDIGWFVSDAEGTLMSMSELVDNARRAKPDIKLLIADIVHRTFIGGRGDLVVSTTEYNNKLVNSIEEWNTEKSPVKLVEVQENYDCYVSSCPDGYDGLHPNAQGEYKIAQAFSRTLVEFGVGKAALKLPGDYPPRVAPVPKDFEAIADPRGILASWKHVFGSRSYEVRERLQGASWSDPRPARSNIHLRSWVIKGQTWEMQVRTVMGDDNKSDWSGTMSAKADPKTPSGPEDIITKATADGVSVTWKPPQSGGPIDRYEVLAYDSNNEGSFVQSFVTRDQSRNIHGLAAGHTWIISVLAWNSIGGGMPTTGRSVIPGGSFPSTPGNLNVVNDDATTVTLSWSASSGAAGYRVWTRNWVTNEDLKADEYGTTGTTSHGIAFLFPGTWNFEFCVSAYNGHLESALSQCVRPPVFKS